MRKLLAYPLTILYLIFFGLSLLIFHPIQWFCINLLGYQAHKSSVDILNLCLIRCTHILGVRYTFENDYTVETGRPVIIVSNHQSMNDIPPIIWFLRRYHPKFISKKELGKGIPSVSFNLRHGGSVLIDRKDPVQSVEAITSFAKRIKANSWGAVIFPEGTRSRDGNPRPFKRTGLEILMQQIPNAVVIPVSISNSWKTLRYGKFPMGIGVHLKLLVHEPMGIDQDHIQEQIHAIEKQIVSHVS